jgi:hypothetical protein
MYYLFILEKNPNVIDQNKIKHCMYDMIPSRVEGKRVKKNTSNMVSNVRD